MQQDFTPMKDYGQIVWILYFPSLRNGLFQYNSNVRCQDAPLILATDILILASQGIYGRNFEGH